MSATERFTPERAASIYGLNNWGQGYFAIGPDGHLRVTPGRDPQRYIDVPGVVEKLAVRNLQTPILLRFPQLLGSQVEGLAGAFNHAITEYGYPSTFHPVFPIKVNQQRRVVESLLQSGWKHNLGLEVGSVPEILAATAVASPPGAVTICNGYKDDNYMRAAGLAARLGRTVIVVLEKLFEVDSYLAQARENPHAPLAGIRIRLRARGSGLWEKSGGQASKFGLSTAELLAALERFTAAGLDSKLVMLHFHIGSQLTEIRKVKAAVREGARVYAKVARKGIALQYLDVGGGLGVDYDGSRTSSDASMNYTVQEYANDVVYTVKEVCEEENVEPPRLISESGRWLTAYHSMLIMDVRDAIQPGGEAVDPPGADAPPPLQELAYVAREMGVKNYRESYHDALEYRDQIQNMFNLGMLSLEDRATGEELYWSVARKSVRFARTARHMGEEFVELAQQLRSKYICNFSVFQSIPDQWALDALFPVMPIHRLDEKPTARASLVDITCDSDGEVDQFVDLKDVKPALEVHPLREGEPYWLGVLLIGAYQDTMGDLHNLFGRVNEAEVLLDPRGETVIREMRAGGSALESLEQFGYGEKLLMDRLETALRERVNRNGLTREEADLLLAAYRDRLATYTYLD